MRRSLWAVAFGIPYFVAGVQFRRIVEASARDVLERRKGPREPKPVPPTGTAGDPPPVS